MRKAMKVIVTVNPEIVILSIDARVITSIWIDEQHLWPLVFVAPDSFQRVVQRFRTGDN